MTAYFKDNLSGYILKFDMAHDIVEIRKQTADYTEVNEEEYNKCHGIVQKETKTLTLPKK